MTINTTLSVNAKKKELERFAALFEFLMSSGRIRTKVTLAKICDISRPAISNAVNGKTCISAESTSKILNHFKIDEDDYREMDYSNILEDKEILRTETDLTIEEIQMKLDYQTRLLEQILKRLQQY